MYKSAAGQRTFHYRAVSLWTAVFTLETYTLPRTDLEQLVL